MKRSLIIILSASLIVVGLALFYTDALSHFRWENLLEQFQTLERHHQQKPLLVSLSIFFGYVLVTTFSIPIATIIALLSGALLGPWIATGLLSLASMFGGCATFLLSRHLFRPWIEKKFQQQLQRLEEKWGDGGYALLASLRIQPIFPYILINLLFGLSRMKLGPYAIVSFFSLMPNTFVIVLAGNRLASIRGPQDIYRLDVLLSLLTLAILPSLMKWLMSSSFLTKLLKNKTSNMSKNSPNA